MFSLTEFYNETLFNKLGRTGVVLLLLIKSLFSRGDPPLDILEEFRAWEAKGSIVDFYPKPVPDSIPSI